MKLRGDIIIFHMEQMMCVDNGGLRSGEGEKISDV